MVRLVTGLAVRAECWALLAPDGCPGALPMALSAAKTANSLGIGRLFAWVGLPFVLDRLGGCGLLAFSMGGLAPV